MTTQSLAIAVLIILTGSTAVIAMLVAGLNRQLELHRQALKTLTDAAAHVHIGQNDILAAIKAVQDAVAKPAAPRSLGLSKTAPILTPPKRDPEASHPRRRNRKGGAK